MQDVQSNGAGPRRGHTRDADWACFYASTTPSPLWPSTKPEEIEDLAKHEPDEFFLLMDGQTLTMKNGKHPGIFFDVVKNGMPEGYRGYGPKHGGLEEANGTKDFNQGAVKVSTFDDLGDSLRFAEFMYCDADTSGHYTSLCFYSEWKLRKSTGRFKEVLTGFRPGFSSESYYGQCSKLGQR